MSWEETARKALLVERDTLRAENDRLREALTEAERERDEVRQKCCGCLRPDEKDEALTEAHAENNRLREATKTTTVDALLANGRLREERDRLREALKKIAAEDFIMTDDGTVRIPGPFAKIARAALAKGV